MAKILMTGKELAERELDIARNYKTTYMYAAYGFKVTTATINAKAKQNLNNWYTEANIEKLRAVANQTPPTWGFDCVNLTKGILWGWVGDESKTYGGASYGRNGVPDTNANGMIQKCYDVSTDFSDILIGEGLWMEGHWGLYVGDGLAVECTNRWTSGVQITAVLNIGKKSGYNGRKWTKHGKLPWIDYTGETIILREGMSGEAVKRMQEALLTLGYYLGRWGADGDFDAATANAVMAFQDKNGLEITGVADAKTLDILYNPSNATAPVNPTWKYRAVIQNMTIEQASELRRLFPTAIVDKY